MLGNPFQSQAQKPAGTVPYRLSNGALVPGHAMHQQASAVPTPTSPVARQSISHLFHSQMQPGQQSRPPVRPNQAPPPRQFVQPPVQAQLSRPLDRTGAGYVSGLRSQTRSRATDSVVYPLQPGQQGVLIVEFVHALPVLCTVNMRMVTLECCKHAASR